MQAKGRRTAQLALLVTAALGLAACGDDDRGNATSPGVVRVPTTTSVGEVGAPPTTTAPAAAPDPTTTSVAPAGEADDPCDGRDGVDIPAVEIPAVTSPDVVVPDQQLAGETVPGFTVPGVDIPAQRVPAQCALVEEPPAGCLGAVEIPGTTIPATSIPAATIPSVSVAGVSERARTEPAVTEAAKSTAAVSVDGVCVAKRRPGELRPGVLRPGALRPGVLRPGLLRPGLLRPGVCVDGECIESVQVEAVQIEAVQIEAVQIESEQLESKVLPEIESRCVRVLSGGDTTSYSLCNDVLFAFDRADIRPQAASALRQVARSIAERSPQGAIRVEGHTDSRGGAAYNQGLSERRAGAVRDWLVDEAGVEASRIEVRGFGADRPVASNGSGDGRSRNRRVVIGVTGPVD